MLILEIAIGVVLGGLLLSFLPALIELGGTIFSVLIAVAVLIFVLGFLFSNPSLLAFVSVVAIAIYANHAYKKAYADVIEIKDLEKRIAERRDAGYEPLQEQVEKLAELQTQYDNKKQALKDSKGFIGKIKRLREYKTEQERRKSLGYDK